MGNFEGGGKEAAHCKVYGPSDVSSAKSAGSIVMLFGMWKHVLDAGAVAYWRHLANRIEPSVCGSDVALCQCQISLITCYLACLFTGATPVGSVPPKQNRG